MPSLYWSIRRVLIALACAGSVALGLALVWEAITRESLERITTLEMLAVLGLLVLPGAAAAAMLHERRGGASIPADLAADWARGAERRNDAGVVAALIGDRQALAPAPSRKAPSRRHRRRLVRARVRVRRAG